LAAIEANIAASAAMADDLPRRVEINYEFHRLLARAAKNPVLIILTDALIELTRQFIDKIGYQANPYVLPSRRRMLTYLRNRDGERAAREMEAHLKRLQRNYLERVGKVIPKRTSQSLPG
jgi:DNA-binding FadR family transcriptional regulator